jgi:nucleoside-diphosphate-sugar epimerase
MSQRAVLVTGGTGFIGRNIIRRLLKDGWRVAAVCRRSPEWGQEVHWISTESDVQPFVPRLREEVESIGITHFLHLAGTINGSKKTLEAGNEKFTEYLMAALSSLKASMDAVYLSSVAAADTLYPYGRSKRRVEELIAKAGFRSWVVLRPSLVYGPHDNKNVAALARVIKRYPLVPIPGSKRACVQPLHVDDLADALVRCLEGTVPLNAVFTVPGPEPIPLWRVACSIKDALGSNTLLFKVPVKPAAAACKGLAAILPFIRFPVQQLEALTSPKSYDPAAWNLVFDHRPRAFETGIRETLGSRSAIKSVS